MTTRSDDVEQAVELLPASRTLDEALEAVCSIAQGDLPAVKKLLAETVHLSKGDAAVLLETLTDASGMEQRTLASLHYDQQCAFEGQLLRTSSQMAEAISEYIQREQVSLLYTDGSFYSYTSETGFYNTVPDFEVMDFVGAAFESHPELKRAAFCKDLLQRLKRQLTDDGFFARSPVALNLENGFLKISPDGSYELLEHGPDHRARFKLSFGYDSEATCPTFLAGLSRTMPDAASREALKEMCGAAVFGLSLSVDNGCRMIGLFGPPNSGKSSLLETMRSLFPPDSVASVQPCDMEKPYMAAELVGKPVNIVSELDPGSAFGGPRFKAILSCEEITVRRIYEKPFSMRPTAWHFGAGNDLPQLTDKTGAFDRRMRLFECPNTLSQRDVIPGFRDQVRAEMPGIINWLAEGASRALARGYFPKPPEHDRLFALMRGMRSDVVREFVASEVDKVDREQPKVLNRELFEAARDFARRRGGDISHVSPGSLGHRIAEALWEIHGVTQEATKAHGGVPQYRGIKLRRATGVPASL